MKSVLFSLEQQRAESGFSFAGFEFPKYLWDLPKGPFGKRIKQRKPVVCGAYYCAPTPQGRDGSKGFYLDSDGMPDLRWQWCDNIANIRHTGWFCDNFQDTKIRGIVMQLPRGRGFLAGWSMGESMVSEIEYQIYDDAVDAAWAADSIAECVAEREREYRESEETEEEPE